VVHTPQASVEPQESLLLHLSPLRLFGLLGGCATQPNALFSRCSNSLSNERRHTLVEFAFLCRLDRLALSADGRRFLLFWMVMTITPSANV
jgi:hypothetical protein